ncbi:MAG: hypothetical protein CEE38_20705 [Planctomycetes bacterium B3_Pla]|nr:MAG: hypothetical protein CEE38_20705 [Planctomycetes bacterium B3_Pla]
MRFSLLALVVSVSLAGTVQAGCPTGDLNGDCRVDLLDVQLFAGQWLNPSDDSEAAAAGDLDGVDGVNMVDFALLGRNWLEVGIPLTINEVMASNRSSLRDPQGQYDDWIEIYNSGTDPINVGNMYLTDDLERPTMWRIPRNAPAATTIPAGGYLLIWADDDTGDSGLHANFKLDADGDYVALFAGDGVTLIHSVAFGRQTSDMSYGSYPDSDAESRFLAFPTPGRQNDGAYLGEVKAPQFSHKRGFYDAPFSVTVATETDGATIQYTLDGANPYESIGRFPTGTPYTGPVSISRTTCLRVKAIKPGWKPSAVKTATFLMNVSEAARSLPAISLVGSDRTTFYEPDGVMAIVGGSYAGNGTWTSSGGDSHNNPMRRGMEYERPVSFEWIMPGDNSGFQVNCGLRVHGSDYMRPRYRRQDGNWTGNGKFAFRLYFRGRYGPNWLEYPLFPFEVERFKSIVLRGGHNDRVNPFIKDELMRRLQKDMGHVASGGRMANLFINGEYKGYFNPCEHIKDAFCQQWYGGNEPWDVMTMSGLRDGSIAGWNDLLNYARNNDLSNNAYYQEVGRRLDIPAFIDYLILQLWNANWDWPQNNWSAAAEQSDNGLWRFFVWDAEGTMESGDLSRTGFGDFPSWVAGAKGLNNLQTPIAWLYRALKDNQMFRQLFGDRLYRHFYNGGALTAANITARFMELHDEMLGVIPNMDMYILNGWVPNRLDIFLDTCAKEGVYTSGGPTFSVNGLARHGGHIADADNLTITRTGRVHSIYYTVDGSDPLPPGTLQSPGTLSKVLVAEHADKRAFVPMRGVSDNWKDGRAFDDSAWSFGAGTPGAVGYEMKRPPTYTNLIGLNVQPQMYLKNATCYIRIPFAFGGSSDGLDSMTLRIKYNDGFLAYINGVEVARRNFSGRPTWNSNAETVRPASEALEFESIDISASLGALKQGGNLLAIQGLSSSATDVDFFISAELLADESPSDDDLPGAIQYEGPFTLSHSACVKARVQTGGTWSALSEAIFAVGPVAESLRITEIMYHPAEPNEEFIELKNVGAETINLNLVSFTDGIDFVFPESELAPGEYAVFVRDAETFAARYQTVRNNIDVNVTGQYAGRLNDAGERIRLQDAAGRAILDFDYKDGWRSLTDGKGFSLTVIDSANPDPNSWGDKDSWRASAYVGGSPGHDDSGIIPNPGAVVVNELLANSPGTSDWIELHNTTGTVVDIGGWFLSDSKVNLSKYQIAGGTTISPYGYVVFVEDLHFGNTNDPGCREPFALSENGERLYLSSAQNGVFTGYRSVEDFGDSVPGVSFGRHYKSSTDTYNFVAMAHNTPGSVNAGPKVGPIVISEIMYNPDWPVGSPYTNDQYEYVELHNVGTEPVTLINSDNGQPWKFTDGIKFTFPDYPGVTIPAGGHVLVVKNMDAFSLSYSRVPAGMILGPYDGRLSNAGERLELGMPSNVADDGEYHYIRVDRVNYSDGSHPDDSLGSIDFWPTEPDGYGASLKRKILTNYGNDPANWTASIPSPGE